MSYDRRYTDRDVRENPILNDLARDYLYEYGGDFDFLVNAKLFLAAQGYLPTAILRGILNCMRMDAAVCSTLPPPLLTYNEPPRRIERRPARLQIKAQFKLPYVTSTHKSTQVAHLLNAERSGCYFYPHTGKYQAHIRVWCGRQLYEPFRMLATLPEDRRECKRCRVYVADAAYMLLN